MFTHPNDKGFEKLRHLETGIAAGGPFPPDFPHISEPSNAIFPSPPPKKESTRADLYRTTYLLLLHAIFLLLAELVVRPTPDRSPPAIFFAYKNFSYLILFVALFVSSSSLRLFRLRRIDLPYVAMYALLDFVTQALTAGYTGKNLYFNTQFLEVLFALVLPPIALWFLFLVNDEKPTPTVLISFAFISLAWALGFMPQIFPLLTHTCTSLYWTALIVMATLLRDIILTNTMRSFNISPPQYFYTMAPAVAFTSILALPFYAGDDYKMSNTDHARFVVYAALQVAGVYLGAVVMQRTGVTVGVVTAEAEYAVVNLVRYASVNQATQVGAAVGALVGVGAFAVRNAKELWRVER